MTQPASRSLHTVLTRRERQIMDVLFRRGRAGLLLRFALALLSFPLVTGLVGTLQGFLWDYWRR